MVPAPLATRDGIALGFSFPIEWLRLEQITRHRFLIFAAIHYLECYAVRGGVHPYRHVTLPPWFLGYEAPYSFMPVTPAVVTYRRYELMEDVASRLSAAFLEEWSSSCAWTLVYEARARKL